KLSGRATITVAKNNLLRLALQQASEEKPDLVKLSDTIEGQTAVVTADINPFRLFKELEATKTRAPARGGEVAPEDLWVRAGETRWRSTIRSSADRSPRLGGRRSPSRSRLHTRPRRRSARSSRRPTRRRWSSPSSPSSRRKSRSGFSSRKPKLRCSPSSRAPPARPTRRFAR